MIGQDNVSINGQARSWYFSFLATAPDIKVTKSTSVRKGPGHAVKSYLDLATKVAALQFMNRDYVLLFRGQNGDYKNLQKNTSLKPSLFRQAGSGNPSSESSRIVSTRSAWRNAA